MAEDADGMAKVGDLGVDEGRFLGVVAGGEQAEEKQGEDPHCHGHGGRHWERRQRQRQHRNYAQTVVLS